MRLFEHKIVDIILSNFGEYTIVIVSIAYDINPLDLKFQRQILLSSNIIMCLV